jgi:HPt (histidine-containing phosphotransfer) domain-containing protein
LSVPSPEDREDAVSAVLRGLSVSAARANLARSALIAEAVRAAEDGQLLEQQRAAAAAAAHQVVGSAGTFGLPRASRMAAGLEDFFAAVIPLRTGVVPAGVEQARVQVDELTTLLAEGSGQGSDRQTGAE